MYKLPTARDLRLNFKRVVPSRAHKTIHTEEQIHMYNLLLLTVCRRQTEVVQCRLLHSVLQGWHWFMQNLYWYSAI
jgi:hypothetical protein